MNIKDLNQFIFLMKKTDRIDDSSWKATTAKRTSLTIPEGYRIYDTDIDSWFSGDGSTVGGVQMMDAGGNIVDTIKIDAADLSDESAVRIGDWVGNSASGSAIVFTSGMDLYSDGQLDILAVFGECSSDLTSAYSAKCGRFRNLLSFGTDTVVAQETYGLIGQMVVKNASLNHYHAGLMGTVETNTDCDIQANYGVGCVSARFGGSGLTVESGGLFAGFLSILNASTFTATGTMAAFATKKTAGASTATWPIGIYMQPSSVGRILDAGTASDKVTNDSADTKFVSIYTDCGASSGDNRGIYNRLYLTSTGGGESLRSYTDISDTVGTAHGAHISIGFGESTSTGAVTGLGVAGRFTLGLADIAYPGTGTLAVVQSEIYSFGASADPAGNAISMFRVVNDGNSSGMADVDDDALLLQFAGFTAGDGNMVAEDGSPGAMPNAVYSVRCKMSDGTTAYLYLGTTALTA